MKSISLIALALLFLMMSSIQVQAGELHDAAGKGDIVKVRQLIEQGADVNDRDAWQNTPLHWAAGRGKTEVAALLIQQGADIKVRDINQNTPLHFAANNCRRD